MITTLTPDQRARFPEFVERWTRIGLSAEPADRPTAERAVRGLYAQAKLPAPPAILWVPSPYVGAFAAPLAVTIISGAPRRAVRSAVDSAVNSAVYSAVYSAVDSAVDSAVYSAVYSAKMWWHYWYGGQFWCAWSAWGTYMVEVLGVDVPIGNYADLAKSAGYVWLNRDFAMICERPVRLAHDGRGRLHCETGKALEYPDGWGLWMLHGVMVPDWVVLTPAAEIAPERILAQTNAEVRRELIRKVGILRLKAAGKAVDCFDGSGGYELIDMGEALFINRYAPYLVMRNPSVPGVYHMEGVPVECRTVEQALHARKPEALRKLPVDNDLGCDWYQQGDVCIWPEDAIACKRYPSLLT